MMRKQDSDSLDDFKKVYTFTEAFDEPCAKRGRVDAVADSHRR